MYLADYRYVATSPAGRKFYIENTPPMRIKNGDLVFWGMTLDRESVIMLSHQADCKNKRVKINSSVVNFLDNRGNLQSQIISIKSGWLSRQDNVGNAYVTRVCYPVVDLLRPDYSLAKY